jgi:hypothetical protein
MGVARLLAKAWMVVCLYAGAVALTAALRSGGDPVEAAVQVALCTLLFALAGLLFAGGFGLIAGHMRLGDFRDTFATRLTPGFDEAAFLLFALFSFLNQMFFAPWHMTGPLTEALEQAIYFVVPGQRTLNELAMPCMFDGGRLFASSFSWFLALVYLGSSLSRLSFAASRIRRARKVCPEALGERITALVLGVAAVGGIVCFYGGAGYRLMPCSFLIDIPGALFVGLAPLMTIYALYAALAALVACNGEK